MGLGTLSRYFRRDSTGQPLKVSAVTQGSRLMIWAYPSLLTIIGLLFILQSASRLSSQAFTVGKAIMPFGWGMDGWGVVFCWIAAGMYVALLWSNRQLYIRLLIAAAGVVGFWCSLTFIAAVQSPTVSFTVPVWVGFPIVCLIATARSLRNDWVMSRGPQ